MRFIYNDPKLKLRRKELRERSTEAEDLSWSCLSNKKIKNTKFYRQYSVGPYILDFYCPKQRLGIELDGGHHIRSEEFKYDKQRTEFLMLNDIRILRFPNSEVENNIAEVLK